MSILVLGSILSANSYAYDGSVDRHIMVAMRTIGHEVLQDAGDSTSLVLPITKVEDRYNIKFGTEFMIVPEELVVTIEDVVKRTNLATSYLVEVQDVGTGDVVYSYRIGGADDLGNVTCKSRALPHGGYELFITILELDSPMGPLTTNSSGTQEDISSGAKSGNELTLVLLIIPFSVLVAWSLRIWKKKQKNDVDPRAIPIGAYQFDKRNMELSIQDQRTDLTSKEADLLSLLHSRANDTVQRDEMLREVWGDDGDYIGRTLDVFISKLRKKLEADPSVRIANIRGVGYKLILNDQATG